jgi:phosphoglycerol transferase
MRTIAAGIAVGLVNLVAVVVYGGFGAEDLGIALSYQGDGFHYLTVIKGIVENGWFFENPRLGAPFAGLHLDFPIPDLGTLVAIKLLTLLGSDPAAIFNILFLAGFFLVPLSAYVAARGLDIPAPASIVIATAFNLLPFHYERAGHLFYTLYFTIPIYVYVAMRLIEGNAAWGDPRRMALRVALVAAAATFGLYYAIFGFALLVFTALHACRENTKAAAESALLAGTIIASLLVCLSPNIIHRMIEGPNAQAAKRSPAESEYYALRASLLVIPPPSHRVPAFARAGTSFRSQAPLVNENASSWAGSAGAIGLTISVLAVLGLALRGEGALRAVRASRANVFLLLFGTMGGIGAIFNYLVWPQIRAYNRISVFIAFVSLLVLALAWRSGSSALSRARGAGLWILCGVVLLAVAADEVPGPGMLKAMADTYRPQYEADRAFARELEARLPRAAMVFQLPHIRFPESPPIHRAGSYDGFVPYLHTNSLRFSFGAMRGRPEADWIDELALLPPQSLAAAVERLGFAAILVERRGYADGGQAIRQALAARGIPVLRESGDYIAFGLNPPPAPEKAAVRPLVWRMLSGFHGIERWNDDYGGWCEERCVLELDRTHTRWSPAMQDTPSSFEFSMENYGERTVRLTWDDGEAVVLRPGQPRSVVRVNVPRDVSSVSLRFESDSPALIPGGGDPRRLAFRILGFRYP